MTGPAKAPQVAERGRDLRMRPARLHVMHLEPGQGHLSLLVANFGRMLDEALAHL